MSVWNRILMAQAEEIPFTVDVHLLAELGERLVGKPAIALGELVKNSYDADASATHIHMSDTSIRVVDDGHGMTEEEIRNGFLRIGTDRKEQLRESPIHGRRFTGSKGVGRLATQMLGRVLVVETRSSLVRNAPLLRLLVNWDEREQGADLTEFTGRLERPTRGELLTESHGTAIEILKLTREWSPEDIEDLGREIWTLRSPFASESPQPGEFAIEFSAADESFVAAFDRIVAGWIHLYEARVRGELHLGHESYPGGHPKEIWRGSHVHLELDFQDLELAAIDDETVTHVYEASSDALSHAEFEVRIFKLEGRQPLGLSVSDVREYLNEMGGVYLYDEGFRLPYYGPDNDWLRVEMDHAHRIARSKLLPENLQVPGGQTFLPTTSRLFGAVHVSTAREHDAAGKGLVPELDRLHIQVSRDRLLDTHAFRTLRDAVRFAIDFYANEKARRRYAKATERDRRATTKEVETPDPIELLERVRPEVPDDTYQQLHESISTRQSAADARREVFEERTTLLATLATAGMAALAVEHEQGRMLASLDEMARALRADSAFDASKLAHQLTEFAERLRELRAPFMTIMDEENRKKARLRASSVIDHTVRTLRPALRGIEVEIEINRDLRLPEGSLSEWTALFQNVTVNAANAVLGVDEPRISIDGSKPSRGRREIRVLDNGTGVDLDTIDELFEPFVRRLELPAERRALGMGGTGLGLTIVRMLADSLGCEATFMPPPEGWSTAFVLRWTE